MAKLARQKTYIERSLTIVDLAEKSLGYPIVGELKIKKYSDGVEEWSLDLKREILPAIVKTSSSNEIRDFIGNLLPESYALDVIRQKYGVSELDSFNLLALIGEDVSGRYAFLTKEKLKDWRTNSSKELIQIDKDELKSKIEQEELQKGSFAFWQNKLRLSVAGVQPKLNVIKINDGLFLPVDDRMYSTHILKVDSTADRHLVFNEFYHLRLARSLGLDVAECEYLTLGDKEALLVKRFDRNPFKQVLDGCQLLNVGKEEKYQTAINKTSFERLLSTMQKSMSMQDFEQEKRKLFKLALFNLVVNNFDAHLKNISFIFDVETKRLSLAPAYDLVNIGVYPEYSKAFALQVDGAKTEKDLNADHWQSFVSMFDIPKDEVQAELKAFEKAQDFSVLAEVVEASKLQKMEVEFRQVVSERLTKLQALTAELSDKLTPKLNAKKRKL